MCEKCQKIDTEIAQYRRTSEGLTDRFARAILQMTIEKMQAEKAALHSEPDK